MAVKSKTTKNKPVVAETPSTVNVTLAAPVGSTYGIVNLTEIRRAPNNRKRFNADALNELAESIKAMGVAQPILIRPVTPTDEQPEKYEIVAGERRYRASTIAGMETIPALIRELSDLDADKLRILENLQREDPHPIEEAEGYQDLMLKHGYNADQLAIEIKKSRSHVFGRLKLCALNNEVREKFLDGAINASIALLIARIPIPALQSRALAEVTESKWPTNEPMSFRKAAEHIQGKYMLDLLEAPFDLKDAKLLGAAGSCAKCPKRTGNQPDLYPEIKSADVCTDPDCFGEKRAAYYAHQLVVANKKGITVYEGEEARAIRSQQWNRDGEFVSPDTSLMYFDRNAPETRNSGSPKSLLTDDEMPPVAAYIKEGDGKMVSLYLRTDMQAALEKNGACETVAIYTARMSADDEEADADGNGESNSAKANTMMNERAREAERLKVLAEAETRYRVELYKKLRARGKAGFSLESLREFVKMLVRADNGLAIPDDLIGDVYPFPEATDDAVCDYIDHATLPEVQLILVDLVMGECLSVTAYDVQDLDEHYHAEEFNALVRMARHEEVDPDAVRARLELISKPFADIHEGQLVEFITAAPDRLADLTRWAMESAPHLVGAVETAAKIAGYKWKDHSWVKDDTVINVIEPEAPTTDAVDTPAPAATTEPDAGAKPKKAKKVPSPAAAWPFPRAQDISPAATATTETQTQEA